MSFASKLGGSGFGWNRPAWREALRELGVADLVGETLREQVRSIFESNEITPSAAADQLSTLLERVQSLYTQTQALRAALDFFEIGAEELPPGEFEVGFVSPRPAVDDELGELGEEFIRLKQILGPFLELSTGGRPEVRVRSIGSSGFEVFLHSLLATAVLIATTIERLISSYEKVVNIRLAHQQLRDAGVSDEALEKVSDDAERKMGDEIEELVEELLGEADHLDPGRANELRTELRKALNALANRIDRGYNVEVRAGELPEPDLEPDEDLAEDEETKRLREQTEQIRALQERLGFMNLSGRPILELPEPEES